MLSRDFVMWTRIGDKGAVAGAEVLAGAEKHEMNAARLARHHEPYCFNENVKILAAARAHAGPRHMRSDVDRIVFGRDMDASEATVLQTGDDEAGYSWNIKRLERAVATAPAAAASADQQQQHGRSARGAPSAAAAIEKPPRPPPPSLNDFDYAHLQPAFQGLAVSTPRSEVASRRLGASRATKVNPHTHTGNPKLMVRAMANNPMFQEEMAKWEALRGKAAARPKPVRTAVAEAVSPRRWGA